MTLEVLNAMSRPDVNGTPALPKRGGPKGLLPSTWLNRSMKIEYVDGSGARAETSGTLLDVFPAGPILNMAGAKTLIAWDRLVLLELAPTNCLMRLQGRSRGEGGLLEKHMHGH